jgi:hypothetical protein
MAAWSQAGGGVVVEVASNQRRAFGQRPAPVSCSGSSCGSGSGQRASMVAG